MDLTEKTILELLDIRDTHGVLSIFVGITPDRAAEPEPGWPIEIRNQLRDLRQRVKDEGPHDRRTALDERIGGLERDLERLLDASNHGRGRALFATVDEDRVETISIQIPFADRVVFDRTAYVRPLVAALEEGRTAGIAVVHKGGVRVIEWRLGEAEELTDDSFTIGGRDWKEKTGPAPAQPQDTRIGGHKRDQFEDRVDENRQRFIRERARDVAELANDRGWDRLVVAGDPRLTNVFADEMNPVGQEQLRVTDLSWEGEAPNNIATLVWDVFKELRAERARELVELARDRALSGGAGALGPSDVLSSLNEGRVERLIFDDDLAMTGFASEEGLLYADAADAPTGEDVADEPLLIERMIERALHTSASVTPVQGAAAQLLTEHGGVAALLRW